MGLFDGKCYSHPFITSMWFLPPLHAGIFSRALLSCQEIRSSFGIRLSHSHIAPICNAQPSHLRVLKATIIVTLCEMPYWTIIVAFSHRKQNRIEFSISPISISILFLFLFSQNRNILFLLREIEAIGYIEIYLSTYL